MIFERGHFDSKKIDKSFVNESYASVKTFSASRAYDSKPTIFISHKHSDLQDLQGVIGLLQDLGAKIYIDSMDIKMPKETSGDTAKRIKEVIKYCKKFVLLATEDAIRSYWCNWELGIGDTHKFKENIAILPMKEIGESNYKYIGNEYLQIYPQITHYKGFTNYQGHYFESGYYISSPYDNYITKLEDWLRQ